MKFKMHTDDVVRMKQIFDQVDFEGEFELIVEPVDGPGLSNYYVEFPAVINEVAVSARAIVALDDSAW